FFAVAAFLATVAFFAVAAFLATVAFFAVAAFFETLAFEADAAFFTLAVLPVPDLPAAFAAVRLAADLVAPLPLLAGDFLALAGVLAISCCFPVCLEAWRRRVIA